MIKAVLDANVWVSGLIFPKGPPGLIIDYWLGEKFQAVVSPPILLELLRVLQYPRIRERVITEDLLRLFTAIVDVVDIELGQKPLDVLKVDPDDNIYLSCVLESQSVYLVTGNLKHFLEVGEFYKGVRILNPSAFLEILQAESEDTSLK